MPRLAATLITIGGRYAWAHIVIVAAPGCAPKDLAHDRSPLGPVRCNALAVQAIGNEMTHLVRNRVVQEVLGVLLQQSVINAYGVLAGIRHGRRHPAEIEGQEGTLKAALEINFGTTVAGLDRVANQRFERFRCVGGVAEFKSKRFLGQRGVVRHAPILTRSGLFSAPAGRHDNPLTPARSAGGWSSQTARIAPRVH